MKNKKNKKAEIATFLTLGMILVGTVLTIATSFFANKTKNLSSNPRAQIQPSTSTSSASFANKAKNLALNPKAALSQSNLSTSSASFANKTKNLTSNPRTQTQPSTSTSSASATLTLTRTPTGRSGRNLGSGNAYLCEPNNNVSFRDYTLDGNGCDVGGNLCPNDALPFACVVVDDRCNGEPRYRWYGCLGQPCENTKIKQGGHGPGHLVGIPDGMAKYDDSKCQSELATPTPTTAYFYPEVSSSCPTGTIQGGFVPGSGNRVRYCVTPTPTTPPAGGGTLAEGVTPGASAPTLTYTPTPTPFCQNINIPQIKTGINVGLANGNGEGTTVSIDDIVNVLIRYRIRMELSGAKTIEEIRFRMDRFISDAILQGIGKALSNLSSQITQTNLMYIKINDILIPTPVYIIQKEINIVGFVLNNSGIVASLINNLSHRFVDSVINNICQ